MSSFVNKINRLIILVFALAPFVGYLSTTLFNIGWNSLFFALFFLSVLLIILSILITNKKVNISGYTIFFFFFLVYTIVSDLYLADKDFTLQYIYLNRLISSFFILFIIDNITFTKRFIIRLPIIFIFVFICSFLVIVYQEVIDFRFMTIRDYSLTGPVYDRRLHSIFSATGANISLGLTVVPYLAILVNLNLVKGKRALSLFFMIIGGIVVLLSKWRWIMLNYFLLFFIYIRSTASIFKSIILIIMVTTVISFAGYYISKGIGLPVDDIISNRIFEHNREGGLSNMTAGTRIFAFYIFVKLFPENPWFGKGRSHSFGGDSGDETLLRELQGRTSQIHVGYLSLLYYYGIFGGLLYFIFLYKLSFSIFLYSKKAGFLGIFYGFLGFILMNFTEVNFDILQPGVIMILVFNKYNKQNYITKSNVLSYY